MSINQYGQESSILRELWVCWACCRIITSRVALWQTLGSIKELNTLTKKSSTVATDRTADTCCSKSQRHSRRLFMLRHHNSELGQIYSLHFNPLYTYHTTVFYSLSQVQAFRSALLLPIEHCLLGTAEVLHCDLHPSLTESQ